MKSQLELSDIAPYLPYGLKITGDEFVSIEELDTLSQTSVNIKGRSNTYGMWADISDIKPLLIPLSYLYKSIDGVIHANVLYRKFDVTDLEFNGNITNPKYGYDLYQYLIEYHFDIFGLIEQGLALDKTESINS